jgi:hypothetical protein
VSRILISAAIGLATVFAALVLYIGIAMWLFSRELPPDSDVAIGFDLMSLSKPSWMWLAAGVIFAAAFVVTYRRVK